MKKVVIGMLVLLWSITGHPPAQAVASDNDPAHAPSANAHSENWTLAAFQAQQCSPNCGGVSFDSYILSGSALDNKSNRIRLLKIPSPIARVDSAYFNDAAGVLVAIGHANNSVEAVTVVDLRRTGFHDSFIGYSPILSSDQRYIAFERFYPPHGVYGPAASDVCLIYDLTRTPSQNRLPTSREDPQIAAGLPVYPRENRLSRTYRSLATNSTNYHSIVGSLHWARSDILNFVDRINHVDYAVSIDLTLGPDRPLVSTRRIGKVKYL